MRFPFQVAPALACVAVPLAAQAARPLVTDDANIASPRTCQLETWTMSGHGSTASWFLPACDFGGDLELSVGAARAGGLADTALQVKTLLRALASDSWGAALATGTLHHAGSGQPDWYANLPVSVSLHHDEVLVHVNAGWLNSAAETRSHATWGLATEIRLTAATRLVAEEFAAGAGKPQRQLGLRLLLKELFAGSVRTLIHAIGGDL